MMLADYYKLKKLKSVWIGLIVMFLLLLLGYCAYWVGIKIVESRPINPADPEADIMKEQTIEYLKTIRMSMLYGSTSTVRIELFVAIIACIFIGKDFSCGATAIYTARGTRRAQTYFSKLFSLITLFVAYSCIMLIFSGIFSSFDGRLGAFGKAEFAMLMRNFFLQLLCGIASISIFTMIAFLTRSSGAALATNIGLYVVLGIVIGLISIITSIDGNENSDKWAYFLPLQQMSIASTVGKLTKVQKVAVTVMPIVYTVISTLIGYFTFAKRDIK